MDISYPKKARLIVLTDISSLQSGYKEPDDTQSLIRLLLYSNHFNIEGLIATYSDGWKGTVKTEYLEEIVKQYGKVRSNLLEHSTEYPEEEQLLQCIKAGSPYCGLDRIGEGMDTQGSDWIIHTVDKPDPRPIWLIVWGGPTDLAQALWRVKSERSEAEFKAFSSKIRVYAILDQYDSSGPWIRENCQDVFYITNYMAFRGMYRDGDQNLVSSEWVNHHIIKDHGPLGLSYPDYDGGDPWGKVTGIKEGDTPSLLYLIPNGLSSPEHPNWGSWGGRFEGEENRYFDAKDEVKGEISEKAAVYRWRGEYQRSFQARMDWCAKPFGEANHEPIAIVEGSNKVSVHPGETIMFTAENSYDPDGDKLFFEWWVYKEAGSYQGKLKLAGETTEKVAISIPDTDEYGDIHLILSLTDNGDPGLTSYRRIIIEVI
jgi:hypothetical protein